MTIEEISTPPRDSCDNQLSQPPELPELYKEIIESLPQSLFLLDANRYIIGVYNIDSITLLGYPLEDLVGKHISVFSNDPTTPFYQACLLFNQCFDSVFTTGHPMQFEYKIDRFHFEAIVTKIQGNRILIQIRDITHIIEKQQEAEHKNSGELTMALTAGGLTPWSYNVQTRQFSAPQNNNSIIGDGISFDEMCRRIAPAYRQTLIDAFGKLISGEEKHCEFILLVQNQTGSREWINVHATPQAYTPDGNILALTGLQKDVSREYEMTREIENNRSKLALAIRSGGLWAWEYNPQNDIIDISTVEEHIHMRFKGEFRTKIHADDLGRFDEEVQKLMIGKEPSLQVEVRFLLNGEYRWLVISATVFRGPDASTSVIGLTQDITADRQATNELIDLRNKADEANRLKSAFIANMSHEIRTPLNAIVGFSTMLVATENEEEKKNYMEIVEYNNSLLLNLISDVLDLSRLDMGAHNFTPLEIRIDPFFRQLLSSLYLKLAPKSN